MPPDGGRRARCSFHAASGGAGQSRLQLARLCARDRGAYPQDRSAFAGRQPARHINVAARRASARLPGWPRLLPPRRLQATCGSRFFTSRRRQFAPRFASEKIRDHRSGAPRHRAVRSRSLVNRNAVSVTSTVAQLWAKADRPGVRAFFLSIAALAVALMLALYSGAAAELGRVRLASISALAALLVAGWVSITLVPVLARRTPLRWLGYKMEYKVTREGWFYMAG